MKIIERIMEIMEEKGYSKTYISDKIDVSHSTMSTWCIRKKNPPAEYLIQFCEILGVSMQYLLTGENHSDTPSCVFNDVTNEEMELINLYRKVPRDIQLEIRGELKGAARFAESRNNNNDESMPV